MYPDHASESSTQGLGYSTRLLTIRAVGDEETYTDAPFLVGYQLLGAVRYVERKNLMEVGRYAVGDPVWVRFERERISDLPEVMTYDYFDDLVATHTTILLPANTPVREEDMYCHKYEKRSLGNGEILMLPGIVVCKRVSRDESEEVYRRAGGRIQYCVHCRSQMTPFDPNPVLAEGETPREHQDKLVRKWVEESKRLTDASLEGIEVSLSPTDSVVPRKCTKHTLDNLLCDECAYFHHGNQHLRTTKSGRQIVTKICVLRVLGP